jgi:acyl-CoA synthetase (AMP-forming)/AMP-acid ligase II
VAAVAVYAVPDPITGDQVMAALELHPGASFDPESFATKLFMSAFPSARAILFYSTPMSRHAPKQRSKRFALSSRPSKRTEPLRQAMLRESTMAPLR